MQPYLTYCKVRSPVSDIQDVIIQDAMPSVAESLEPVVPRSLRFMTVGGEQLTAFHKPTTPFQPIALYEDIMEPALGVGEPIHSSGCSSCQPYRSHVHHEYGTDS